MNVRSKLTACQNRVNGTIFAAIHFCNKSSLSSVMWRIWFSQSVLLLQQLVSLSVDAVQLGGGGRGGVGVGWEGGGG